MVDTSAFLKEQLTGSAPQSVGLGQVMADYASSAMKAIPTPRFPGEETYASPEALMAAKTGQPAPTPELKGITPMAFKGAQGSVAAPAAPNQLQTFVERMAGLNIPFGQAVKFAQMMPKPVTPVDMARSEFLKILLAERDAQLKANDRAAALKTMSQNLPAIMAPGAGTAALSPIAMGMGMVDYPTE